MKKGRGGYKKKHRGNALNDENEDDNDRGVVNDEENTIVDTNEDDKDGDSDVVVMETAQRDPCCVHGCTNTAQCHCQSHEQHE